VRQAAGSDDIGQLVPVKFVVGLIAFQVCADDLSDNLAKRTANRSHFQGMGEPVVDKGRARKRKYLGFVLESAECGRKDQAVKITLEAGPEIRRYLVRPYALVGVNVFELHGRGKNKLPEASGKLFAARRSLFPQPTHI
jgi:hypothetical protein